MNTLATPGPSTDRVAAPVRSASTADGPEHPFWFVDVFAGIGGFRRGLSAAGGTCRYSIEWDTHARKSYLANYGHEPDTADVVPFADLLETGDAKLKPYHLLAAG